MPTLQRNAVENDVEGPLRGLLAYCRDNNWAGYDPYDALNSRLFGVLPFLDSRLPRLVLTQALKRSPVNIRPLLLVPKRQNAKAIALFLSAFVNLAKTGFQSQEDYIELMIERLIALRSPDASHYCWGYSFPWQTRTIVVPAGAPNLVCTTFVGSALLDAYEMRHETRCLSMAVSAAGYILDKLYWTDGSAGAGFSYPLAGLRGQVHNSNFLAAALLCRVYKHTGEEKFLGPALRVARYSATQQRPDGSWAYGEAPTQQWIDNFHTGYNLCALRSIGRYTDSSEFESHIRNGFEFYRAHFIREDGAAKYFHDRPSPVDIHCVAQTILTLLALKDLDPENVPSAHSVLRWAMTHMWDQSGFFYYRVLRSCTIRTSYMRWSQAWMFLALSALLCESHADVKRPSEHCSAALA